MRTFSLPTVLACATILTTGLSGVAIAAPTVTFNPTSLTVTKSATFDTPPIVVQNATGVSAVTLNIIVPSDVTLDTTLSGSSIACITQGSSVGGLFFAEWNASQRKISITCAVTSGSTLEIVKSIEFTTPSSVTTESFALSGSVTGGSGLPTFTSLTIRSLHIAGDVDKDSDVDKTDADLVLQYLMGDIAKTTDMDANGDGSVNISDAQWILAHPQAAG